MAGKTRVGPLAKVAGYINNVMKEAEQVMQAGENYVTNDFAYRNAPMPMKTPEFKKTVEQQRKTRNAERGQFFGALLQNRQYDDSGKQIKKKKKK